MASENELHGKVGELTGKLDAMAASMEKLTTKVDELTDALNQVKGAKYGLIGLLGVASAVGSGLTYLGFKMTVGH